MPAVSEKQERFMNAVAHNPEFAANVDVPQSVGKEFVAKDGQKQAAGVLFVAPDGDVLLLLRSPNEENFASHWALPGGGVDAGETAEEGARREVREEMGDVPCETLTPLCARETPNGLLFTTYICRATEKFAPTLNDEHSGYAWVPVGKPLAPIHPAVADVLTGPFMEWMNAEMASDADFKESDHKRDDDGKFTSGSAKHASLTSGDIYSKFVDAEDLGGSEAVKALAKEMAAERPDLIKSILDEAGNLGVKVDIAPVTLKNSPDASVAEKTDEEVPSSFSWVPKEQLDAAREIQKAAKSSGGKLGLRVIPHDQSFSVGDVLPASNKWKDGERTGKSLPGTSTIKVSGTDLESILSSLNTLGVLGDNDKRAWRGNYWGSEVALVSGSSSRKGEDYGEAVIGNAKVVGIWSKDRVIGGFIQPSPKVASDGMPNDLVAHVGRWLAFDKASLRSYDQDGRMKVERSTISKAVISPYIGKEIVGWRALGLEPNKTYRLLRDPEELKAAADTFNNLPILSEHVAVSASAPRKDLVIGSTGTDAAFDGGDLTNSLVFWDGAAIGDIEAEKARELSCAYHYKPDMTPGTYEGQRYDGVMREIKGNHVALVSRGRCGPAVYVADAADNISWSHLESALLSFFSTSRTP